MGKLAWKGGTLLAPVPAVMVSCGDMDNSNIITAAWCGIMCSDPPKTYVSIRPERHSYGIIKEKMELAINLTTEKLVNACDYCGIKSGRDADKFEKTHLTKEKGQVVSCPIIKESPLTLECKVIQIIPMGSHDVFICDIVATDVDDSLVDAKGKLHLDKAGLITYSHGTYYRLGKPLGNIGFSHAKKTKKKPGGKITNKPRRG